MTLLELIMACAILMILASSALPVARYTVKRQKETELKRDLREMRDAIDAYKDAADRNLIRVEVGTEGYPPDLDTLVKGVDLSGPAGGSGVPQLGTSAAAVAGQSGFGAGTTSGFGPSGAGAGIAGGLGQSAVGNAIANLLGGQSGQSAAAVGNALSNNNGIRHVRFLRRVPVDPMTGQAMWGMRSVQDDPDSSSWGGKDVFDVFTMSSGTALDGTKYSDW